VVTDQEGGLGAFQKLQRLVRSFDEISGASARAERTWLRLVDQLGTTALRMCIRELGSPRDARAQWAYTLIARIAENGDTDRVMAELQRIAEGNSGDSAKMRALALLTDLGGDLPESTQVSDIGAIHERSLTQLAECLTTREEIARAADMLCGQLSTPELVQLVDALCVRAPDSAVPLIDEMLLRADVDERGRSELRRLSAPMRDRLHTVPAPIRPRSRAETITRIGRNDNGRSVITASRRRRGSRPPRWRALCALIGEDGDLIDGLYRDDYTAQGVERDVIDPLTSRGYTFETATAADCATLLASAARATHERGQPMPRGYYLGRDLLDLYDEHLGSTENKAIEDNLTALLGRAVDLLGDDQLLRARPLLERYVTQRPSDAEGWTNLGLCVLSLGDASAAHRHLSRAAHLEPDDPVHDWNIASAAHRDGRLGGCYLALTNYIDKRDAASGATGRVDIAQGFVAEFERLAALEHPGSRPIDVAKTDEYVDRACKYIRLERYEAAITTLTTATELVPTHYRAWGQLGSAHLRNGALDDAGRDIDRALALRPADPVSTELAAELRRRRDTLEARRAAARKQERARAARPRTRRRKKKPSALPTA
jgi:Flp pilus assembly protein TadD